MSMRWALWRALLLLACLAQRGYGWRVRMSNRRVQGNGTIKSLKLRSMPISEIHPEAAFQIWGGRPCLSVPKQFLARLQPLIFEKPARSTQLRGAEMKMGEATLEAERSMELTWQATPPPELPRTVAGAARAEASARAVETEQLRAMLSISRKPATVTTADTDGVADIAALLKSKVVKGVGPKLATALLSIFGSRTLEVLRGQGSPEEQTKLDRLAGLGKGKLASIRTSVEQWDTLRTSLAFCRSLALLSEGQMASLVSRYGDETEHEIRRDPYLLLELFPSLRFDAVDAVARGPILNIADDSPERVRAALHHNLNSAMSAGHCCVPRARLVEAASHQLHLGNTFKLHQATAAAKKQLDKEVTSGAIVQEVPPLEAMELLQHRPAMLSLAQMHAGECYIAKAVRQRLALEPSDEAAYDAKLHNLHELSERQQQAVELCRLSKLLLLTGGPGTGKTYTVRAIVQRWKDEGKRVLLACPTARAASVLANAARAPASTIHRLLEYNPLEDRFERDASNTLEADCVVIDEASMLDVNLMGALFNALRPACTILMVGDVDQLPSVGPGAVLHDLLRCRQIPRVALDVLFRQDPSGDIARNAGHILQGEFPSRLRRFSSAGELQHAVAATDSLSKHPLGCFLVSAGSEFASADVICEQILPWLRDAGYDLMKDVQVLSPMKGGAAGTHALNSRLQRILNPNGDKSGATHRPLSAPRSQRHGEDLAYMGGLARYEKLWMDAESEPDQQQQSQALPRVGDKMIQLVNDYENQVFNGDIGEVKDVWQERGIFHFQVDFRERRLLSSAAADIVDDRVNHIVDYTASALNRVVTFAYALTVHKAQGGEYPVVVMPIVPQHKVMLYRNLLYTALSRAKKLFVMVGSEDAVRAAVENGKRTRRATLLADRIGDRNFAPMVTRHLVD